jgi:uncharacterized protein with HEPN domain
LWLPLQNTLDAIGQINSFMARMDFDAFRADSKTVAAVERKLLNISEGAIRLGEEAENLCPSLPWRDIRGISNWLRHQYDAVDVEAVWWTVVNDLPLLHTAVISALAKRPLKNN